MASSSTSDGPKCGNPYQILNLPHTATNSQIKKKFRELSLKFHPDKRKKDLTAAQNELLDKQFIQVQEARSFLLDTEHAESREKYDDRLRSQAVREEENRKREEQMSGQRKSMKEELERKMKREEEKKSDNRWSTESNVEAQFGNLKKAGKRMREVYDEKRNTEEANYAKVQRKKRRNDLGRRQIRLKWSRKKVGGQSEYTIAKILSQFGEIDGVELIGSKGNSALVTFKESASCKPCVDAYQQSEEMRASFVGSSKNQTLDDDLNIGSTSRERDRESVDERKLRQAAERERLLREMENGNVPDESQTSIPSSKIDKPKSSFPPHIPASQGNDNNESEFSYLARLEEQEKIILKSILSPEAIREMQVTY
jgi:curved DNA-binding protein CbpA